MEENLEIEYKLLLSREQFDNLTHYYDHMAHVYTQTNTYFTSQALQEKRIALRIREKEKAYEMTVKTKAEGTGRKEYNLALTKEDAQFFLNGGMKENEITSMLKAMDIDLSEIKILCRLKTIRHDIQLEDGMLSLDANYYHGQEDYEMEFELCDLEAGKKTFTLLLKKHKLSYQQNCESKLKRALSSFNEK